MFNFNKKKVELKELKEKPEKSDTLAIIIAAFITLIIPIAIIVILFYGLIALIFLR